MSDPSNESGDRGGGNDWPTNVFDRIFPGPARNDPELRARLESIARTAQQRATERQRTRGERRPRTGAGTTAGAEASTASVDAIVEALHEQTEVLRGLLDAEIAVRDDARATAQNSRTFAVAGTVIAFFTMVAAVVTVVVPLLG